MFLRCYKEVENLPKFGLVSPLKAQERRVRVVPIIGGESDDKEFHRSRYLSHSCSCSCIRAKFGPVCCKLLIIIKLVGTAAIVIQI